MEPDAALETPETAAPETTPPVVEAPAAEVDEYADPEPLKDDEIVFDRKYVETLRDREAKYRIAARDAKAAIADLGDLDAAKAAKEFYDRAQSDDGRVQLFIEAGQSLGLGYKEMEALFDQADAAAAASATAATPDPDTVMTYAEFEAELAKRVIEPQQRAEQARIVEAARTTVFSTLDELKVEGQVERDAVLALGQKHIADNDFDPGRIRSAIHKGHQEFVAARTADREKYLKEKLETKELVPSATGGAGAAGGEAPPPPKDMDEAKARARARLASQ